MAPSLLEQDIKQRIEQKWNHAPIPEDLKAQAVVKHLSERVKLDEQTPQQMAEAALNFANFIKALRFVMWPDKLIYSELSDVRIKEEFGAHWVEIAVQEVFV